MLSYYAVLSDQTERQLKEVTAAVIDCDVDIPADSARLMLPCDGQLSRSARGLIIRDGDNMVFRGDIDSIVSEEVGGKASMKLSARSLAARLLDNEAEPLDYRKPSAEFILRRHAEPFGISAGEQDRSALGDRLRIVKGMSHWQVIEWFCHMKYHSSPCVTPDGVLYLKGLPKGGTAVFGNGAIPYTGLKESRNRHRLISEIRLKTDKNSGYRSKIANGNPECAGTVRRRYVDVSADNRSMDTVRRMLDVSNRGSYVLSVTCPGCRTELLGYGAEVASGTLGRLEKLRITGVKYTSDSSGERSVISFEKEEF